MSYDSQDAAWDEAYENMSREFYPEHKEEAIVEFTQERLRSYYVARLDVLVPAIRSFKEAKKLLAEGHNAAALVFAASATELFLKSALLRPVVYGLVHSEALAELVVKAALSQTGFRRYKDLLAKLFVELAGVELKSLVRKPGLKPLLDEASEIQDVRNHVVHEGHEVTQEQAEIAVDLARQVRDQILVSVLRNLGFTIQKEGFLVSDEV